MYFSQYPYNYEGRSTEYLRKSNPSFFDLYTDMVKFGFSTTEIPLSLSLQQMADAQMNYASGLLTKEDFENSPFFDRAISYRKGMTQAELELLKERVEKERALASLYENANSVGDWTAIIGGMITGSLPSVTNFLPTVSTIPRIQQTVAAMKASKLAKNALVGAADAATATAIYQAPYAFERLEYQQDYDWTHAAIDLSIGIGLGGTLGAVLGDFRVPTAKEMNEVLAPDQRIADFGQSVIDRSFTNTGKQVNRSEIWFRARQNEIAKIQAALDQPIDVNFTPLATNREINNALENSIPTTPDLDPIIPDAAIPQQKKNARDANNATEAGETIRIFDTEETRIAKAGGEQVLIVPLSKNTFAKYMKKEAKELMLRAFAIRNKRDTPFTVEGNTIKYADTVDAKGNIVEGEKVIAKPKDLRAEDATYEKFMQLQRSISEATEMPRPTHLYLTKQAGQKNYESLPIYDRNRIEERINQNVTDRIQVDSFNNKFSSDFKKLDPADLQGISEFNARLRATRYQPPLKEKPLNYQVVDDQEILFEPAKYDPEKYEPILAEAETKLDADLQAKDWTDAEALELEAIQKNTDEMIAASEDLHNSVANCVWKNARV